MRLRAWTATSTSVARRWSACARKPSPITCFHLPMAASARARLVYPDAICQAMRPCSAMCRRHRQVDAGKDREAASLIGATASCGSFGARDLSPDREGLRPDGSVLGGGEVIAVKMEEVVDLVVGGEEPLRLAG